MENLLRPYTNKFVSYCCLGHLYTVLVSPVLVFDCLGCTHWTLLTLLALLRKTRAPHPPSSPACRYPPFKKSQAGSTCTSPSTRDASRKSPSAASRAYVSRPSQTWKPSSWEATPLLSGPPPAPHAITLHLINSRHPSDHVALTCMFDGVQFACFADKDRPPPKYLNPDTNTTM
jgi:hypothetical protein